MPKPRTEDQILSQAPLKLKFGESVYDVRILTVLKARKWREEFVESLKEIAGSFADSPTVESIKATVTGSLIHFPEKMADLIFAYASELPKDKILEEATEEQLAAAFSEVMAVAYPFLPQLGMVRNIATATIPVTTRLQ